MESDFSSQFSLICCIFLILLYKLVDFVFYSWTVFHFMALNLIMRATPVKTICSITPFKTYILNWTQTSLFDIPEIIKTLVVRCLILLFAYILGAAKISWFYTYKVCKEIGTVLSSQLQELQHIIINF